MPGTVFCPFHVTAGNRADKEAHVQQAVGWVGDLATGAKAVAVSKALAIEGKRSGKGILHLPQRAIGPAGIFFMRTHPPEATAAPARTMNDSWRPCGAI
jgi:hypothetical protein